MGSSVSKLIVRATLTVRQESFVDAFVALTDDLVRWANAQPGTLQYEVFFDASYNHAVFLEQYVDDAAFFARRNAVPVESRQALHELASVVSFEVYGDPGEELTSLLSTAQFFRYRGRGSATPTDDE